MTEKERVQEYMSRCTKLLSLIEKLPADMDVYFNPFDAKVVISNVHTMDELGTMWHRLRECLGSWTDRLAQVWESCGSALAAYESDEWPVEIRLQTPMAEFPKEITGDTCRFEPHTETRYSYVCAKKEP